MPPPGHVRERLRAAAQRSRRVEIEAGRREQVVAVVVLGLEHAADEREAVRVDAGRRRSRSRRRPATIVLPSISSARSTMPTQVPAKSSSPWCVDARAARPSRRRRARLRPGGRPRRRPRRARRPRRGGSRSPRRSRAASAAWAPQREHVVDAVRGEVGAAVAQAPAGAREHRASCRRRRSTRRAAARRRADAAPRTRRSPVAPVDSTAARSRSTTEPAVASETPAAA